MIKQTLALIVGFILGSSALFAETPADAKPLPAIETSSPDGVVVSSAAGRWVKGRLLVSGSVRRKAGYSYPGPTHSHLDFILFDASKRPLNLTQINYSPRPIQMVYRSLPGRSSYAGYLPVTPPAGATVRVAHHQTSIHDCQQNNRFQPRGGGKL